MSIVQYYEEKAKSLMEKEHDSTFLGFVERNLFREAFKIKNKILMFIMAPSRTM